MRVKILITTGLVICLLSSMQTIPAFAHGVEVWSDNFDDGDYDGWTVHAGEFAGPLTYVLRAVATGWSTASHDSEVACGHWYFDLEENQTSPTDQHVIFIALDTDSAAMDGYSLFVDIEATSYIRLCRWDGGTPTTLDEIERPAGTWGWYEYNITRDNTGAFEVRRDQTSILTAIDSTYATSAYFVYYAQEGRAIDNISVWSCNATATITTTNTTTTTTNTTTGTTEPAPPPPPPIPPGMTLALVVGVVVIVIILVFISRRK
ncbi:MAG: hypothetical protein ACFFFC_08595 [Candidatus Thorarchaeota archaeon]